MEQLINKLKQLKNVKVLENENLSQLWKTRRKEWECYIL